RATEEAGTWRRALFALAATTWTWEEHRGALAAVHDDRGGDAPRRALVEQELRSGGSVVHDGTEHYHLSVEGHRVGDAHRPHGSLGSAHHVRLDEIGGRLCQRHRADDHHQSSHYQPSHVSAFLLRTARA